MSEFVRKSVSFKSEDLAIVEAKAEKDGNGFSNAIRSIIREWSEMKKQYITVPVTGVIRNETVEEGIERSR